jgi:hypothetical protein
LRKECKLRVFENRMVRGIFGPKRDEVIGVWGIQHNKALYVLYSSPNIIRVITSRKLRWAGPVARIGERRGACRVVVGKFKGRKPRGKLNRG